SVTKKDIRKQRNQAKQLENKLTPLSKTFEKPSFKKKLIQILQQQDHDQTNRDRDKQDAYDAIHDFGDFTDHFNEWEDQLPDSNNNQGALIKKLQKHIAKGIDRVNATQARLIEIDKLSAETKIQ